MAPSANSLACLGARLVMPPYQEASFSDSAITCCIVGIGGDHALAVHHEGPAERHVGAGEHRVDAILHGLRENAAWFVADGDALRMHVVARQLQPGPQPLGRRGKAGDLRQHGEHALLPEMPLGHAGLLLHRGGEGLEHGIRDPGAFHGGAC